MNVDRRELTVVFVGGAIGALARVGLIEVWPPAPTAFPWLVFAINIAGAFILGFVITRVERRQWSERFRLLIGTGFCGALTTFSTMQLELFTLLGHGRYATAAAYVVASVAVGYAAVVVATGLARRTG